MLHYRQLLVINNSYNLKSNFDITGTFVALCGYVSIKGTAEALTVLRVSANEKSRSMQHLPRSNFTEPLKQKK